MVLAVAVGLRLVYLSWPPLLSDDGFRYVWDGLLQHQGINPFSLRPVDVQALTAQQEGLFAQLNSPVYFTVYPPISQLTFWLATWIAPANTQVGYLIIKAVYTVVEIAGIWALTRLASPAIAILYAWSPLAIVEVAGQGHAEGLVVGALGLALLAHRHQRPLLTGIAGSVAVWAKLIPILVAPLFLRTRRWWLVVLSGLAASMLVWWPYAAPYVVDNVRTSTELYVRLFEFNSGLYLSIKGILLWWTGDDWSKQLGPFLRSAFLVYWMVLIGWAWFRRWEPAQGILWVLGGYLVFATTVHPWYIVPILFIAVIANNRVWVWIGFWSTATYLFYSQGWYWPFVWIGWGGWAIGALYSVRHDLIRGLLRWRARRKAQRLQRYSHFIRAGHTVLDIGAGEGFVGEQLYAISGAAVTLTDVEPTNRTALPFTQATAESLPFADASYDVAYLYFVLHHAQDPERLIHEALRVTKHRLIVAESVFTTEQEYRRLEWLDKRVNRLRGGWMMPQEEQLTFQKTAAWLQMIEAAGADLVAREERGRWLHRQAYLVFRPRRNRSAS
ncbi:MAG: hypothetical protein RhofKO_34170 [Rhodothermales bacterium]